MKVETSSGEIKSIQLGVNIQKSAYLIVSLLFLRAQRGHDFRFHSMHHLPRSPAASHSRGPSVTPGMGAKVADTKVATLRSVSELLSSRVGGGAGVGEVSGDGSSCRGVVASG